MKLDIGDRVVGLEYAGDSGIVTEILTNGKETVYTLQTSRADGFSTTLRIGYGSDSKLRVLYDGRFGSSWHVVNWKIKKQGTGKISLQPGCTLFKDKESYED